MAYEKIKALEAEASMREKAQISARSSLSTSLRQSRRKHNRQTTSQTGPQSAARFAVRGRKFPFQLRPPGPPESNRSRPPIDQTLLRPLPTPPRCLIILPSPPLFHAAKWKADSSLPLLRMATAPPPPPSSTLLLLLLCLLHSCSVLAFLPPSLPRSALQFSSSCCCRCSSSSSTSRSLARACALLPASSHSHHFTLSRPAARCPLPAAPGRSRTLRLCGRPSLPTLRFAHLLQVWRASNLALPSRPSAPPQTLW